MRALAFLTVVPMPSPATGGLDGAAAWFPLVGAAIGASAGAVRLGAEPLLGRAPATVLALIALVALTGALHQDGLADTADGLGVRGDRPRRFQVMRDPATGVFGALALIGWALLVLTTLTSLNATQALVALTVACALARWAALLHASTAAPARSDGLGAALTFNGAELAAASLLAVGLAVGVGTPVRGSIALAAAALTAAAWTLLARGTVGGRTGDTLGAAVALTEAVVCLAMLAAWHG